MSRTPQISVIIPTYNRANCITKAIDSVLAQSFQDFEIIVWDDGSTDDTREIVKAYGDHRIRYYFGDNHGVSFARNRAIEQASGKYIAFLDSDDVWEPEKLLSQLSMFNMYDSLDIICTDNRNINKIVGSEWTSFGRHRAGKNNLGTIKIDENYFVITTGLLENIFTFPLRLSTIMVKKDVLFEVGLFDENLRNGEDRELWWRIGLLGKVFGYIDLVLVQKYQIDAGLSSFSIEYLENKIKCFDKMIVDAKGYKSGQHDKMLRAQLWRVIESTLSNYAILGEWKKSLLLIMRYPKIGLARKKISVFTKAVVNAIKASWRIGDEKKKGGDSGVTKK